MNTALEAELVAADPRELARLARERGDVERGRKVFLDARTTCAACHHPPEGVQRLGPNLAELPTRLSDVELVESLLMPSKRIEKEYVQLVVVTDDGKQRAGMKVEENDGEIVLRNPVQPEPIRIAKGAIEEVSESPVSIMPAGLVRMLESRRDFDDLLRYVLETRSRP
jgi:putative heme-binding domain-containing protein